MENKNTNNIGIIYTKTGDRRRGRVMPYHQKPTTIRLNDTLYDVDIEMISPKKRKEVLNFTQVGRTEFAFSRFTIGFEVEKTYFARGVVKEYELFCGFETDSSCGYEAVTHILPLLPPSKWRMKVFDMMFKAKSVIDSPCDTRCGGHINIGVYGHSGAEIMEKTRGYMGIVYALFRYRLKQHYCKYNPRLLNSNQLEQYSSTLETRYHHKYRVALDKMHILELRLPSRVENVKQLMRRYELMYELVDTAFNSPKTTFKSFLKKIHPILMRMYDNDEYKVHQLKELAVDFQKYINTGFVSPLVTPYIASE